MSTEIKTSRQYAAQLRRLADFLDSRPEFDVQFNHATNLPFFNKDKFVTAVQAIGSATKSYTEGEYGYLHVKPVAFPELNLNIPRSSVCRKVVKYECESLFSDAELEAL